MTEQGQETILLVEDEPALLKLTSILLERLGYHIIAVDSPDRAIEIVREYKGPIHMLMTDVIMPGMNGRELALNIMPLQPDIKLLFMSGYTADIISENGVLDRGINFIQKPFVWNELGKKIRSILDH